MIEKTIDLIIKELSPSDGGDLRGMDYDICAVFENSKVFECTSIEQSDDVSCMFIINLQALEISNHISEILNAICVARESITYSHFSAHSLQRFEEQAILKFVTVISEEHFYVTGKIVISGKEYQRLYRKSYG